MGSFTRSGLVGRLLMVACLLLSPAVAFSAALFQEQALVVYDSQSVSAIDESAIVKMLKDSYNFNVTTKAYTDEDLALFVGPEPAYEHVVLLPTTKKAITAKSSFNQHQLLRFLNANGNLVVAGGVQSVIPDDIRGFLNELGIYPSPKNFQYTDHFNANGENAVLGGENLVQENVYGPLVEPVPYVGSAALLSNNELLFPIIKGSKTSFTADIEADAISQDKTWTFGEQGFVAAGFQGLNNARLVWVGAEALLNDELLKWAFQKKGVLKLQYVQHYKADEPSVGSANNNTLYRIKDQVIYVAGVSELVDGKWVPFDAGNGDNRLQLAFKMLDPYQRLTLQFLGPTAANHEQALDSNAFFANFTVPDQHGMFTFELDYKRVGLSYLLDKRIVAVRHLANDEYKRSWDISNSWLYVASAGIVVLAWFLFVVNFIYIGNVDAQKKNE